METSYFIFLTQDLLVKTNATDASGNIVFGDIGVHIQQEVRHYLVFVVNLLLVTCSFGWVLDCKISHIGLCNL